MAVCARRIVVSKKTMHVSGKRSMLSTIRTRSVRVDQQRESLTSRVSGWRSPTDLDWIVDRSVQHTWSECGQCQRARLTGSTLFVVEPRDEFEATHLSIGIAGEREGHQDAVRGRRDRVDRLVLHCRHVGKWKEIHAGREVSSWKYRIERSSANSNGKG